MRAIVMNEPGAATVLHIGRREKPQISSNEVLIRVHATALNRADLLQRRGMYPPPKGATDILGLEAAGEVVEIGADVSGIQLGERVCSLLPGGGYAEYAAIPSEMVMKIPENLSYEEAAGIPEVYLTSYLNLFMLGNLQAGDNVLVHAGASGVGTAAIQLIREAGAQSYVTAGSQHKIDRCLTLGAKAGWNYNDGSFKQWIKEQTDGNGVKLIFDFVGAPYFQDNLESLDIDGRLIIIGTLGGIHVNDLNLGFLLRNRLQIIGTALRSQPLEKKIQLTKAFSEFALHRFRDGRLKPVIDRVYDWENAAEAHAYMESNANIGKIILRVTD